MSQRIETFDIKSLASAGAMVSMCFDVVGESDKFLLSDELTVTPKVGSLSFGGEAEKPEPIIQYFTDHDTRTVSVPFWWGWNYLKSKYPSQLPTTSFAYGNDWSPAKLPDPHHPNAAEGQADFFDAIIGQVKQNITALIEAPTGSGKTVAMLNAIGSLGKTALVVVPSKALAEQWKEEAIKHLGLTLDEIGLLQGSVANWKGRKIVIAVIHNLFQKEFTSDFYDYFGTVCWDEAHRLGAPEFAKTMPLFRARHRIAATATPTRKDGCMKMVHNCFGPVSVRLNGDALPCECRVLSYSDPFYSKIKSAPLPVLLKVISKSYGRNRLIADQVNALHKDGRNVLVLSDRIEHLQTLQTLLNQRGIKDEIGLFVGSYMVGGKRKQTVQGYLNSVRDDPKYSVILATYSMMKEGVNIPRLDAGIDATPRADGIQAIGRIRRPLPNKRMPIWLTVVDQGLPLFEGFARARMREYQKSKVTILS
jgi:superfamily II DNA or RNA helicase